MKELQKRLNLLLELEIRARDTYSKILKDTELAHEDGDIEKILKFIRGQEVEHIFAAKRLVFLNNEADKRKQKPEILKNTLSVLRADFIFRRTLINTATALLTAELETFILLNTLGEISRGFKEKAEARSEMVAKIAHQLKTPPVVSNWISEVLMKELNDHLTGKQKRMIEQIRAANQSMISFINDLTDVYRAETEEELKMEDLDLTVLVKEEINKLILLAESIGKNFDFKFPTEKTFIQSNSDAFRKIASNLLINALHYGAKKDKINVAIEGRHGGVIFSVSDHGIGIPKKEQGKIFEKFFRASNVRKVHPAGTGLGLYIVKELAEKIGGRVWFESARGRGTTFFVEFSLL